MLPKKLRRMVVFIILAFMLYLLAGIYQALTTKTAVKPPKVFIPPEPPSNRRENATFVVLCRNSDLEGMKSSMRYLESRFNHNYRYPYIFLNDEPFTEEFKQGVKKETKAQVSFGQVDPNQWKTPDWIDKLKAAEQRIELGKLIACKGTSYWYSETYRRMCRFYSGFFFRHPLVTQYEYYWRVEPDVKFYCTIDKDPFAYMKENNKAYGYNVMMVEYIPTIASLWNVTKSWMKKRFKYPGINPLVKPNHTIPLLNFFVERPSGYKAFENHVLGEYNGCHFWSNFEISRVDLWNNPDYLDYFNYIDRHGGFFYERWGDAPVHSLYIAITLSKDQVHFFDNIGYSHDGVMHCPFDAKIRDEKCECDFKDQEPRGECLDPFRLYKQASYNKTLVKV